MPRASLFIIAILIVCGIYSAHAEPEEAAVSSAPNSSALVEALNAELAQAMAEHAPDLTEIEVMKQRLRQMLTEHQIVRRHLFQIVSEDERFPELWKRSRDLDLLYLIELRAILQRHGWIDRARFGEEAEHAAWLLAQHMVHDDGAFQREVLEMMRPSVLAGDSSGEYYALLSDRVTVIFDKKPQLYGTHWRCNDDGTMTEFEIQDAAGLDDRRREAGLGSYEDENVRRRAECEGRREARHANGR